MDQNLTEYEVWLNEYKRQFIGLNGRQIGKIREHRICDMLDRFGYGSAHGLAKLAYADLDYEVAIRCIGRVLQRMVKAKLILKRESNTGVSVYVNTLKGAKLGASQRPQEDYKIVSGAELSAKTVIRQDKIMDELAEYLKLGYVIIGEIGLSRNFTDYEGMHGLAIKGDKYVAIFFSGNSREEKINYIYKWYKAHKAISLIKVVSLNKDAPLNCQKLLKERFLADKRKEPIKL